MTEKLPQTPDYESLTPDELYSLVLKGDMLAGSELSAMAQGGSDVAKFLVAQMDQIISSRLNSGQN